MERAGDRLALQSAAFELKPAMRVTGALKKR